MKLGAVIFDWAGTIVDFGSRAPALAFVELFRRHDVEVTAAEARGPMGTAKKDHIRALTREPAIAARWQAATGRLPGEADVDALYEEFIPLQLAVIRDHAAVIPGVLSTVAALRAEGLKIGSTTGYNREMTELLDGRARAQGLAVDCVVCASDVPAGRPAPWMALEAARRLGVYPMAAVVKIGDTIADVLEGLNAGMWSVGVAETGNEMGFSEEELAALAPAERAARLVEAHSRLVAAGAHATVDSVAACLPTLREIEARADRP